MKLSETHNGYILYFDKGESVQKSLIDFCDEKEIELAHLCGFGECSHAELAHFDDTVGDYFAVTHPFNSEVIGVRGSISRVDGAPFIHAHVVLADKERKTMEGYFRDIIAHTEFEVHVMHYGVTGRSLDEYAGVELLHVA